MRTTRLQPAYIRVPCSCSSCSSCSANNTALYQQLNGFLHHCWHLTAGNMHADRLHSAHLLTNMNARGSDAAAGTSQCSGMLSELHTHLYLARQLAGLARLLNGCIHTYTCKAYLAVHRVLDAEISTLTRYITPMSTSRESAQCTWCTL